MENMRPHQNLFTEASSDKEKYKMRTYIIVKKLACPTKVFAHAHATVDTHLSNLKGQVATQLRSDFFEKAQVQHSRSLAHEKNSNTKNTHFLFCTTKSAYNLKVRQHQTCFMCRTKESIFENTYNF